MTPMTCQPERELILLSAGIAARRRAMGADAERLSREVDWPRLAETLRRRRLLPTLGPRVLDLAGDHAGDGFAAAVHEAIEVGRRRGAFLQLISRRVISALAEAGICCTPLKGPLLGEAIYGDPGRRLSRDIDLLVTPEQLHAAVEVVRELGYGAPADHIERDGLPLLHFVLLHERGELPPVELHWRVHWYERSFARERLLAPTVGDRLGAAWRPAPPDELAALLLFYARDGFIDLRLAADLSAWWDAFGADLQPAALDELLDAYPALAPAIAASAAAADRVVGLPARRIIGAMPPLRLRDRVAVRLANPNPRASSSQLYADRGLVDGLLMPRGDLAAFLKRQVLLPREILDERARRTPDRLRSHLGHSGRLLIRCGVLGRYGLTMVRLMRTQETPRLA
jgi:hypothetical protein